MSSEPTHPTPGRRLLAVAFVGIVPWTVLLLGREATFVYWFGLLNTNPLELTNLYQYLFVFTDGLPRRLEVWPVSVALYAGALGSAAAGLRDFEDPRLTAGLLVFAGVAQLQLAYGLLGLGSVAVPVGTVLMWTVAWWYYWPLIRERGFI
ncbi:MAG: TIGR04206 family protein [Natronomonas sp.]